MKIPLVNVLLGSRAKPEDDFMALSVYRQGPSATAITELPIIMAQNGAEAVTMVSPALDDDGEPRFLETTRSDEFDRLARKFRAALMHRVYPSEAIPLPTKIEHLGLEPWQLAGGQRTAPTVAERREAALAELRALEALEAAEAERAAGEAAEAERAATEAALAELEAAAPAKKGKAA